MLKLFAVFATVFMAELGDKTQLATLLFATEKDYSPWHVFLASSGALVLSTAIAVLIGSAASKYLQMVPLKLVAGIGFLIIGCWTLWDHFSGS